MILAAGVALLLAGILSTRSEDWKRPVPADTTIPLDLQGVKALEIGHARLANVIVANRTPGVRIEWNPYARPDTEQPRILLSRGDGRLLLELSDDNALDGGNANVVIQPGPELLRGRLLNVSAEAGAGALRVEAFELHWQGDADSLDIRTDSWPVVVCPPRGERGAPHVWIRGGQIRNLRISVAAGDVVLDNLRNVEKVDLYAGPKVGLRIGEIEYLDRIELHPFDGDLPDPLPAPAAPGSGARTCITGIDTYL